MSALSALASYDVSDDEGGTENIPVPSENENEEKKETAGTGISNSPTPNKESPKGAVPAVSNIDEEDIWRDPDEEDSYANKATEDSKEHSGGDSSEKDRNDTVNIEDLSGIHSDSEGGESSSEAEGDTVGGLVDAMRVTAKRRNKRRSSENATNLAKKLRSASVDEVTIPPEPEGRCSSTLQDKIKRFMERKVKDGEDLNQAIQARKDFRNPSIYEKLIVYLGIDELGTNFPRDDYNPKAWRKAPAYDELARAQREDMAKREKERKTKVEFVTGTVKKNAPSSSSQASLSDAVKKSKWDQQSSNKTGSGDRGSGHKPTTIISAVGSIKKPKA